MTRLLDLVCQSSQCVRERLAEADFPFLVQHWTGVDIANLVVLALLLVDLSGRAAVLAKGLCVCYCRNPLDADSKEHSPCCRICRRCEEEGSQRQRSPMSSSTDSSVGSGARVTPPPRKKNAATTASGPGLRSCGLVCCSDTIDNDVMLELEKRRFFCCMCRCASAVVVCGKRRQRA